MGEILKDTGAEVSAMMKIDVDAHFLPVFGFGSFGTTKDFDPFLLLDDFRNDYPAIDVWIRLSLKPN